MGLHCFSNRHFVAVIFINSISSFAQSQFLDIRHFEKGAAKRHLFLLSFLMNMAENVALKTKQATYRKISMKDISFSVGAKDIEEPQDIWVS